MTKIPKWSIGGELMEKKRKKIMEAAKKSFSMFGYKGTSVDQIAKIAGVGKGTIYTYFENKEVLLHDIIQTFIQDMKEVANNAIRPERTFLENLHTALYDVLVYRSEHELMIKLSQEVKEFGTEEAKTALSNIEVEVMSYLKVLIEKAIENKKIKECDSEITAFVMFKLYVSLLVDWHQKHDKLTDEQIFELFNLYLMEGLIIR